MNATCAECGSVFRVDPAKIPTGGVRARCSVCGGVFAIASAPARVGAAAVNAPAANVGGKGGAAATPMRHATPAPAASMPSATPAAPAPEVAPTVAPSAAAADAPAASGASPTPAAPLPVVVQAPPSASPAPPPPPPGMPAPRPPEPPRRPVNPYLSADPGARARRLARALVSDLIAYYPAKREEGLRDGTLKQLFREEIKKSWEEYVEQGAPRWPSRPRTSRMR
jgi:predicted Zn finger-like uncharacterized protein